MRHVYQRLSVWVGFLAFSMLLIANALILRKALAVQVNDSRWVEHTNAVLLELSQVQSLLVDAETAQRGYLYTGAPKYLEPFETATQVDLQLDNLEQLVQDNAEQAALVPVLRELSHEKIKELSFTISLYQNGKLKEARAEVLSDRGKQVMDRIRAIIAQMRSREAVLFQKREIQTAASRRTTRLSIYWLTVVSLLGLFLLCAWILRDINARERHAAEIRQREEWWRVTLTSIGDGVIAADPEGRITFMNPIAESLTGFSNRESVGRAWTEIFPLFNEDSLEPVENPIQKVIEAGAIVGLANHTVLKRRDGGLVAIEDSAAPIRDAAGRLVGIVLVFRDTSRARAIARAHEEASEAVRTSEERLRLAVTAADLGLWTWKVGAEEVVATDRCKAIFGLSPDEQFDYAAAIGIVHPDDRAKTEAAIAESVKHGTPYKAEYRVIWRDGSTHWVSAVGRCSYNEKNEPTVLSGIVLDVSNQRAAEDAELRSHKLAAASSVAHELAHHINNPLTIVTNSLYLLATSAKEIEYRADLLNSAQEAADRISRITRQLLGLYSPYATPSTVCVTHFLDEAIDAYASGFPPGSFEIVKRYDCEGDVFASSSDIRQLCSSLVANAFEHAKEGRKIVVRVAQHRHPIMGNEGIRLLVADNGPGIAKHHRDRLFNVFFSTKETKGSGLGLWISRSIANKYGGTIRCKTSTRPGRSGTAFQVFIPAQTQTEPHSSRLLGISA